MEALLRVEQLSTNFYTKRGIVHAVADVSFDLAPGEILGVVGESGSGKSVMGRSIMGLVKPPGHIDKGHIFFSKQGGEIVDLAAIAPDRFRNIRGRHISMIFQEPMSSLNPILTISDQMTEGFLAHRLGGPSEAVARAKQMLDLVKINDTASVMRLYPHQLSGGMRQRVMIAMALMCSPEILIADEPTTALDVTIQAQIVELLKDIRDKTGMAIVFISHNMGVIAEISDSILVVYCGKIMEYGPTSDLLAVPRHPYTAALIDAIPKLEEERAYLSTIPGIVPNLTSLPPGCRFATRCTLAGECCHQNEPCWMIHGRTRVYCHRRFESTTGEEGDK